MTDIEQKRLIQLCGFMGFIEAEGMFNDIYADSNIKVIVEELEKIIKKLKLTQKEFDKIYKKVLHGVYKIEVVNSEDINFLIKRYEKTKVGLALEDLHTIEEHAMYVCQNCNRLRSKCRLRKSLRSARAPVANDGIGKCQYRYQDDN